MIYGIHAEFIAAVFGKMTACEEDFFRHVPVGVSDSMPGYGVKNSDVFFAPVLHAKIGRLRNNDFPVTDWSADKFTFVPNA